MNERRLRRALREEPVPDATGAEERAWRLLHATWTEASPAPPPHRRFARRGVQLAAVGALIVATISPAGAAVRDWVGDAVRTGHAPSQPALTSLPAPGSLLVDSPRGPWIVREDGSKRLLGPYGQSTWSPHGLFVAATTPHQLLAMTPEGDVRWSLARRGPVRDPAWSPDGYRIAYLSGNRLRVVAGDGSGDRLIATKIARVPPAWAPGLGHPLSFVDSRQRLRTMRVDDGRTLATSSAPIDTLALGWSEDGTQLLVVSRGELQLRNRGGRLLWQRAAPRGMSFAAAALGSEGDIAATLVSRGGKASELLRFPIAGDWQQRLFAGPGRLDDVVFSPNGRWLLFAWRSADQWLFLNPDRPRQIVAIADIAAQFDPGTTSPPAFPGIAGWCCRSLGDS